MLQVTGDAYCRVGASTTKITAEGAAQMRQADCAALGPPSSSQADCDSQAGNITSEGPCTRFSPAEILVLAGCDILPAPVLPSSTRIYARLKRVMGHGSAVNKHTVSYLFDLLF